MPHLLQCYLTLTHIWAKLTHYSKLNCTQENSRDSCYWEEMLSPSGVSPQHYRILPRKEGLLFVFKCWGLARPTAVSWEPLKQQGCGRIPFAFWASHSAATWNSNCWGVGSGRKAWELNEIRKGHHGAWCLVQAHAPHLTGICVEMPHLLIKKKFFLNRSSLNIFPEVSNI